jgi:hypothetical protein
MYSLSLPLWNNVKILQLQLSYLLRAKESSK